MSLPFDSAQLAHMRASYSRTERLHSRLIHPFGYHTAQALVISNRVSGFDEGLTVCLVCGTEIAELAPDAAAMRAILAGPNALAQPTPKLVDLTSRRVQLTFWLILQLYRLIQRLAPHTALHRVSARLMVPYVLAWQAAQPARRRRVGRAGPRAKRLITRRLDQSR